MMKKTVFTILMAVASATAGYAQTAYDALAFSENEYEGTARTVAMGNAFTALGGDLGSVAINPAGSAVANYSQFTITPALTFTTSKAQGVSPYPSGDLPYFERNMRSSITKFSIPNFGLTINYETSRKSGLKNVTFGFILNKSANYDQDVYAGGSNSTTSFMGAMATDANGYLANELGAEDAYDYMNWESVIGYNAYMISPFESDENGDYYIGASEAQLPDGSIILGGVIDQTYGRQTIGNKYDYVFNLGANFSDFIYIGANLGISTLSYDSNWYFKESAGDPMDFKNDFVNDDGSSYSTYWSSMKVKYDYSAQGTGVYGKFGAIFTPGGGIRIGAAIQTPTVTRIQESWQYYGETQFDNPSLFYWAETPEGNYEYTLRSPLKANFGLAYTIGNIGVISADYELTDYSNLRFGSVYSEDRSYFDDVNESIRELFGMSNSVRVGAEFKPTSEFAVRAGYNLTSFKERADVMSDWTNTRKQNVSLGVGYNSKNSFYADLACRYKFTTKEYCMPYSDYVYDSDNNLTEFSPEILIRKSAVQLFLTFGWRF